MTKAQQAEELGLKFWHRIQLSDGSWTNGKVNHGPDGGDWPTTRFGLPTDLTGKSVLDIGAYDGFFSFEAEKRGASWVLAVDKFQGRNESDGFATFEFVKKDLDSKVKYMYLDIEEPGLVGLYDLVLLYGVLYHVENPLLALKNACSRVKPGGMILIETAYSTSAMIGMEFRPGFDNDPTNYWYPTIGGLWKMLEHLGMVDFDVVWSDNIRCTVKAKMHE